MKIDTLFERGQLVQSKYASPTLVHGRKSSSLFEIIEIATQTCCAGTQVFYDCRILEPTFERTVKDGKLVVKITGIALGWASNTPIHPYIRLREDELKAATDEMVQLIKEISEGGPQSEFPPIANETAGESQE